MHKIETRARNLTMTLIAYDYIRNSHTSWRRKASYRKPIKRRISKLMRREQKFLLKKQIDE